MLFDQNVVISIFWHFTNSFHGNQLFCNIRNTFVVPAHQTSDMSRFTISPESCLKLEMVTVFCPGFQKGRVPSEKGTLAR